jgi:hypothetical protein
MTADGCNCPRQAGHTLEGSHQLQPAPCTITIHRLPPPLRTDVCPPSRGSPACAGLQQFAGVIVAREARHLRCHTQRSPSRRSLGWHNMLCFCGCVLKGSASVLSIYAWHVRTPVGSQAITTPATACCMPGRHNRCSCHQTLHGVPFVMVPATLWHLPPGNHPILVLLPASSS